MVLLAVAAMLFSVACVLSTVMLFNVGYGQLTSDYDTTPDLPPTDAQTEPQSPYPEPTTAEPVSPAPTHQPGGQGVCKALADMFNFINDKLPMYFHFDGGIAFGAAYPSGKIVWKSEARKMDNCISYVIPGSTSQVMAHIEIVENIDIHFPNYILNHEDVNVTIQIQDNHLVLHYHISNEMVNQTKELNMNVVLAEIKNLGKVTLLSDSRALNGTDYTIPAEDIIRPKLLEAFNRFAGAQLNFSHVRPQDDVSQVGLDVLKVLFQRAMIEVDSSLLEN